MENRINCLKINNCSIFARYCRMQEKKYFNDTTVNVLPCKRKGKRNFDGFILRNIRQNLQKGVMCDLKVRELRYCIEILSSTQVLKLRHIINKANFSTKHHQTHIFTHIHVNLPHIKSFQIENKIENLCLFFSFQTQTSTNIR